MSKKILKITTFLISLILIVDMFFYCSMTVYAFPARLKDGTWIDKPWSEAAEEIWLTIQYGLSQIGVFFTNGADFKQWLKNTEAYQDLWDENGRLAKNVSIDIETGNVTYSKEIMTVLKSAADDYAKEHEPYYIGKTFAFDTADFTHMQSYRNIYNTINNILNESKSGFIVCSFSNDGSLCIADIDKNYADLSFIKARGNDRVVGFYENETWKHLYWKAYCCQFSSTDDAIRTMAEFKEKATTVYSGTNWDYGMTQDANILLPLDINTLSDSSFTKYSIPYLVSKETRRVRVFNTFADFQDYTLNKRSVYYTENYYNYVPEDLTVSIDDLEKAVDDLQKVIDELLKQIQDDTSEKEIEDLLRQILEEIRNGQGTGGGGGGGGDVTVDIDLSTTNGLLSKILEKVTQIYDKMSSSAGQTMDSVVTAIEDLGKMLKKYLKAITGDLDDIKDKLDVISEQEFADKSESFLKETETSFSEIAEVAKTKFPLSIPNDINNLLSALKGKPPEQEAQAFNASFSAVNGGKEIYTYGDKNLITVYEGGAGKTVQRSGTGAPVFTLPLVITSVGWDYSIVVDLSEFQLVADLSRTMFTLIYIYGIILLSIKVIGLWGELVD